MTRKQTKYDSISPLEWAAAALGLMVALALLAVLGWGMINGGASDVPILEARIESVTATRAGYVAQFKVTNSASQTAASVQVEGKLGDEVASAAIDYVPGHSAARGGLMFENNPTAGRVDVKIIGYEYP